MNQLNKMNKIVLSIILVVMSCISELNSQSIAKENAINSSQAISQERIFVHYNTSLIFSGEYFYYKVYCLDANENNLSTFSKVAYVELISEEKNSVFKHKIKLNSGIGQGDFLVPNNVASGNYKLIAYTNWMRNGPLKNYFQQDIAIINPYQENQKGILREPIKDSIQIAKTSDNTVQNTLNKAAIEVENEYLTLDIDQTKFKKRAPVRINLKSLKSSKANGNYSLSVKKIDVISNPLKPTAEEFIKDNKIDKGFKNENKLVFLPELRGDIISGKILDKVTRLPLASEKVVLSIPGQHYILKVATTNENGVLYFNMNEDYNADDALLQVIGKNKDAYIFELNDHNSDDYKNLHFNKFKIDEEMKDIILKRSVYNQIENAYFNIKSSTVKSIDSVSPFYGNLELVYKLDDYTRFSTVRETLVEIVSNLWAKKIKTDEYIFQMRGYDKYTEFFTPWVIVDGVLLQNHNDIMNYSSKKIKSISLLRDKYVYGGQTIEGVVVLETVDGDFHNSHKDSFIEKVKIFKPLPSKDYYNQVYANNSELNFDRIPDYREQLFWEPNITFKDREISYEFFTSDNTGSYEISLEGFTLTGNPISIKKILTVE